MDRYGLQGGAEFTDGKIYHSAIFDDHDDDAGTYTARMSLLHVSKVRMGKCPHSNTAINSGNEPPRLTHAMQAVKFIEATMRLLVVDEAKQKDVVAVKQWVLMPQNTVTVNTSCTKRKHGKDGLPNETPTTTHPSTPSMKTCTQNSTMITPTSNIIPSLDKCHSLSQKFLVLSSFNVLFLPFIHPIQLLDIAQKLKNEVTMQWHTSDQLDLA